MASSHNEPSASPEASDYTVSSDRGGLSNYFKSLTDKKKESNSLKKRPGPKPDSKPARSRRQELNRQAQRTHRERKEAYVKALEDEVLRLKELYSNMSQDKGQLYEENKQLRELLNQVGISFPHRGSQGDIITQQSVGNALELTTATTASSSQGAFTPPMPSDAPSVPSVHPHGQQHSMTGGQLRSITKQASSTRGEDLDQAGIDFVLTLEKPCMSHLPYVLDLAKEMEGMPNGHALMASCPPVAYDDVLPETPFRLPEAMDLGGSPDHYCGPPTWKTAKGDLSALLDLSSKLYLDGEITPVMVWGMVMTHPRFQELTMADLNKLSQELMRKVRCYGFGAVIEEFEARDAIASMFPPQPETVIC